MALTSLDVRAVQSTSEDTEEDMTAKQRVIALWNLREMHSLGCKALVKLLQWWVHPKVHPRISRNANCSNRNSEVCSAVMNFHGDTLLLEAQSIAMSPSLWQPQASFGSIGYPGDGKRKLREKQMSC